MIFYKQCFALYAIIQGEVTDSATAPALLKLNPKSFRNLSPGRICDFCCCCVYYYIVHYLPFKQIQKLKLKKKKKKVEVFAELAYRRISKLTKITVNYLQLTTLCLS